MFFVIFCLGMILFWLSKVIDIVYNCGLVVVECVECGCVYYVEVEGDVLDEMCVFIVV